MSVSNTSPPARTRSTGCPANSARRALASETHPPLLTESRRLVSTLAFIGLGIMCRPMAAQLAKAGHQVVGCERSPQRAAALVEAGGSAADSIAKAVAGADVVAVMVPDSPPVQAVLAEENGVFDNAPASALLIDFSSIRPDVTSALAAQAAERGFRIIDAPVSGGEAGAVNAA